MKCDGRQVESQWVRLLPEPTAEQSTEITNAMSAKICLVGRTFGKLKVRAEGPLYVSPSGQRICTSFCVCECGTQVLVRNPNLREGQTKSCGCLRLLWSVQHKTTHGHAGGGKPSRTYSSWQNMKKRCLNHSNPRFKDYGGRGIKVCDRWMKFANFLSDMGERPKGLTLERMDNDGNYEPGNCRWATYFDQQHNKRGSK